MSEEKVLTGFPSIDRPWMKFYPKMLMDMINIEEVTLRQYLENHAKSMDRVCLEMYGRELTFQEVFDEADRCAAALKAIGFQKRDQVPVFFQSVPEFIILLLACEKIGASVLCRDNTLSENVNAVEKSGAQVIFAHSYLSQKDMEQYVYMAGVKKIVLLDPLRKVEFDEVPVYCRTNLDKFYTGRPACGPMTIDWDDFLKMGDNYAGEVAARENIDRPLFRCYTSGSTGTSKQVIHSARNMMGILAQINFYAAGGDTRPTWMLCTLPPALVAVVVSMIVLPMAADNITRLSPYCAQEDMDLEMMRIKPNGWAMIPMMCEILMRSTRIPADYDFSHMGNTGAGSEAFNNNQIERMQKWLKDHNNEKCRFSCSYGCSEAGSGITLPMSPRPYGNGYVGVPMPLSVVSIFKPGTTEELPYNTYGEICKKGPGNMISYDDPDTTAKTLVRHPDGDIWLHTGDIGMMDEHGHLIMHTRGESRRVGGGDLMILPMENKIADAKIEGIDDEFFVIVPDKDNYGYHLPFLYVVLKKGYTVDDIKDQVDACLAEHERPVEIITIDKRPFYHFKTDRKNLQKALMKRLYQ